MSENLRSKRIFAGIIVMLMLIGSMFSIFIIAHEADHDCTGEDCPICASIAQVENLFQQIGEVKASDALTAIPLVLLVLSVHVRVPLIMQETPVSTKVRMNN